MTLIAIEGVTKRFGSVLAVDGISLEILENEFFALLGPSGCGKTTLLRILAGFETPDEGRVLLGPDDLTRVRPNRRPLNMMFQSYALFPHMSVAKNVAYGLRMEWVGRREALARAHEMLELVQLREVSARRPAQLSGGQRQRVALARALVKRPRVLLLDEPLSALDRQIRGEMQIELKRLQHQLGTTFVVVTHDQEEALTMADRIAVLHHGRVEQIGMPDDLYSAPASPFVARFLGESNLFEGRLTSDLAALVEAGRNLPVAPGAAAARGLRSGDAATLLVRPERLRVAEPTASGLAGVVAESVFAGAARKVIVDLDGGGSVQARVQGHGSAAFAAGARVTVSWDDDAAVLLPGPR